ncbi:arrestin domain-containing protein 3-like [Planococcus citri]|uniref:arrestin domain-containing protein 3-like n=1 Tax=Planococcus citri TaxID=170843 RepID=UPI0031F82FC6
MSVARFLVVLDKSDKVYYSGEILEGRVKLVLNYATQFKGAILKVTIRGRASCEWNESKMYMSTKCKYNFKPVNRKSTETYLESEQVLIEKKENFELPMGEHTFQFAVMIPSQAPSSFNSSYGVISYDIKAEFKIPMDCHKEERINFIVINPLNLDLYPNLKIPYRREKRKTFCYLWCASGPLTMVVNLPKTAFVSSESIPIILEIDNTSNKIYVDAVDIYLKREINWIADGFRISQNSTLEKLRLGLNGLGEGQSHSWNENFTVPDVVFPFLGHCSVMKIKHELHIEAVVSGFFSNLSMHIPITIGNVLSDEDPNAPNVIPQCIKDQIFTRGASSCSSRRSVDSSDSSRNISGSFCGSDGGESTSDDDSDDSNDSTETECNR